MSISSLNATWKQKNIYLSLANADNKSSQTQKGGKDVGSAPLSEKL
jgi:hypothetical protein